MAITPLPPAPLPTDTPTEFNEKAFDLVAALEDFVTETNALAVAVNADATAADADAATATTQAGIATTQAGIATTKAGEAATSASAALTSANNAAASYDSFDDRYLGAKGSNPSVDNDGNALLTGALYWNTSANEMRAWSGSAWVATYVPAGSYLTSSDIGVSVQAYDADIATVTASQAEMEAGTETALRSMSPLRVAQAISALVPPASPSAMTLISTQTVSSATSSVSWTNLSGYSNYKLIVTRGFPSADAILQIQIGYGSTPTYITSSYWSTGAMRDYDGSSFPNSSNHDSIKLIFFRDIYASGGYGTTAIINLNGFDGTNVYYSLMSNSSYYQGYPSNSVQQQYLSLTGRVPIGDYPTSIKILCSSSNNIASGTFSLYGISS